MKRSIFLFCFIFSVLNAEFISRTDAQYHSLLYMSQLHGWCSEQKGLILVDLVLKTKPDVIVEIGVFGGKTLVPMAYALKMNEKGKIYGIDPWDTQASLEGVRDADNIAFWSSVDHKGIMNDLTHKIYEYDLGDYIELIEKTSLDAPPISGIDILHIDANHADDASYFNVIKWVPLMKSGGWIIFDNMTWSENEIYTTARTINWLDKNCMKIAEFSDSCDWGLWVKS